MGETRERERDCREYRRDFDSRSLSWREIEAAALQLAATDLYEIPYTLLGKLPETLVFGTKSKFVLSSKFLFS